MNTGLKTIALLFTLSLALITGGVSAAPSASTTPNKGLHQSAAAKDQEILIAPAEHMTQTGVITAISDAAGYQSVRIKGTGPAGLVLNVSKDTRLAGKNGTPLAFSELHIGMTIEAQHSLISTRSLPPQTPAYQITVLDAEIKNKVLGTAGTVQQVIISKEGTVSLHIQGSALSEKSHTEVVLRLTEDTAIINENGEAVDRTKLVQGAEVIGFYGTVLTRSLPPAGTALKIVLNTEKL